MSSLDLFERCMKTDTFFAKVEEEGKFVGINKLYGEIGEIKVFLGIFYQPDSLIFQVDIDHLDIPSARLPAFAEVCTELFSQVFPGSTAIFKNGIVQTYVWMISEELVNSIDLHILQTFCLDFIEELGLITLSVLGPCRKFLSGDLTEAQCIECGITNAQAVTMSATCRA